MIEVEIRRREIDTSVVLDLKSIAYDAATAAKANQLRKQTKGLSCTDHPDHVSIITIVPSETGGLFEIDKSRFCCQKFAEAVK